MIQPPYAWELSTPEFFWNQERLPNESVQYTETKKTSTNSWLHSHPRSWKRNVCETQWSPYKYRSWHETISMERPDTPLPSLLFILFFPILESFWETGGFPFETLSFRALRQKSSDKTLMPHDFYARIFWIPFFLKKRNVPLWNSRHFGPKKL